MFVAGPLRLVRLIVALGLLVTIVGAPAPASAHTGFESSTPADGTTVDEPVSLVTIAFTGEATPVGDEFVALTPGGALQTPISSNSVDGRIFTLRFEPPLAGGAIGVRWNVQAADSHPIEGAFSFTVNSPAVPATTAPVTTLKTPETAEPPEPTSEPGSSTDEESIGDAAAPVPTSSSSLPQPATTPFSERVEGDDPAGGADPAVSPVSLDAFLEVDNSRPGQTTATVGRLLSFGGIVVGLGALAFMAAAFRGRRSEVRALLAAIATLGGVIVVGAGIEYIGVARIGGDSITGAWSSSAGVATVLRFAGGAVLAAGVLLARPGPDRERSLSSAVLDDVSTTNTSTHVQRTERWRRPERPWIVLVAAALLVVSFWFDGHTVTKGHRLLHAVVNSVHIVAAAVWAGGVVTMAALLWMRRRAGHAGGAMEMVVRFSKLATIALAAVAIAGGVMAVLVLDSFGELTGTQWGKMLLLKTAAVGLAVVIGAYNHFRLLPRLEADPDAAELATELRSTVTAEAIMLLFVVAVTAWLVSAAS